jgi:hypothetical protein
MDPFSRFEIGDIVRLRYSGIRFLITGVVLSKRTGNTAGYDAINLFTSHNDYIGYSEFDDFRVENE